MTTYKSAETFFQQHIFFLQNRSSSIPLWRVLLRMIEREEGEMPITIYQLYVADSTLAERETISKYRGIYLRRIADIALPVAFGSKDARRKGALAKLANDPKQVAKEGARKLWKEWKDGKQQKIHSVEQFATEVMRRWRILESAQVICRWSSKWTKEAKAEKKLLC